MKVIIISSGDIYAGGYRIPPDALCPIAERNHKLATHVVTFKIITATDKDAMGLYLACPECAEQADDQSKRISLAYLRGIAEPCREGSRGKRPKSEERDSELMDILREPTPISAIAKRFRVDTATVSLWLSDKVKSGKVLKLRMGERNKCLYQVARTI